jgi:pilus assembly protein Flp/PilA
MKRVNPGTSPFGRSGSNGRPIHMRRGERHYVLIHRQTCGPENDTTRGPIVLSCIRRAARNDDGASAVEYGLLVAAIAAAIVIVVFALGGVIKTTLYDKTCRNIKGGASGPANTC